MERIIQPGERWKQKVARLKMNPVSELTDSIGWILVMAGGYWIIRFCQQNPMLHRAIYLGGAGNIVIWFAKLNDQQRRLVLKLIWISILILVISVAIVVFAAAEFPAVDHLFSPPPS